MRVVLHLCSVGAIPCLHPSAPLPLCSRQPPTLPRSGCRLGSLETKSSFEVPLPEGVEEKTGGTEPSSYPSIQNLPCLLTAHEGPSSTQALMAFRTEDPFLLPPLPYPGLPPQPALPPSFWGAIPLPRGPPYLLRGGRVQPAGRLPRPPQPPFPQIPQPPLVFFHPAPPEIHSNISRGLRASGLHC